MDETYFNTSTQLDRASQLFERLAPVIRLLLYAQRRGPKTAAHRRC